MSLMMMSQSQPNGAKMFKEALEHMHMENKYLKEKLIEHQDMIHLQKEMLMDVISGNVD
jgi:hypothetical protein